ncbi:hypothetical protein LGQ03_11030 [Loktanella sp. TSTF-M6]|uniref:Uncharacterized protein n=1 Tax=Loktanella gaetbuli TaxID=2881335 RepID=A0ABS8BVQ0_9RHOB|nr:hypothetical protein [Loktanella gaetbuli]MCB5199772.1 hypothetical protein [Loktanella gaetbuli]
MRAFLILGLLTLTACTQPPAMVGPITPQAAAAPFPQLQPLAPLLAQAQAPGRVNAQTAADLGSDADRLRRRAAALRGPVVAPDTRARMQRSIR